MTISKTSIFSAVFVLSALMFALVPLSASAQSYTPYAPNYYYQPQPQYQYQYQYQNQYMSQYQYLQYLIQLIAQLQAQLDAQRGCRDCRYNNDGDSELYVTTDKATDIEDDSARLNASIDYNSSRYGYIWFEYGEDEDDLRWDTPHIRYDDDGNDISIRITDLDEDQEYHFRAVGEDDEDRVDYGAIRHFTTDDNGGSSSNDDEPDVNTDDADQIDSDSARISGSVNMNDFDNGIVFFVYGEDESQVEDIESDYDTYNDVDEDGDDLQKIKVGSGLDGDADYTASISGLNDSTDYYYSICVEYEDEDSDDILSCGSVENFETD